MKKLLPFLFLFLLGCASSKKAENVDPAPGWVNNRPVMEGYYIGIGSARKVGMQHEYVAEARKNALQDMASQISSRVSTTSVLQTIENDYGVSESFSERIEIESDSYLAGFEPVDFYETPDQYWVYYRISKNQYRQNEIRRREEAIGSAKERYQSAREAIGAHHPVKAIVACLQGLEALKGFLDEDLEVGRDLLDLLKEVVSNLSVSALDESVKVKRGSSLETPLRFRINYKDRPVPGIPVVLNYSGGYLKAGHQKTNEKGIITVNPGEVTSGKSSERLEAAVDHESLAVEAVSDLFTRSILKNIPRANVAANIDILSPLLAVQISSDEDLAGYDAKIREQCHRKAEEYRLLPAEPDKSHDYMLEVRYSFSPGESAGRLTSVYLASELHLSDSTNQTIARANIRDIKGVGHSTPEARSEAFQAFLTRLNRRSLDQILDERF
jgi:hypothetical protein